MFDVIGSGLDSIECVKMAKAYKVLEYASLEKDKGIAEYESMKLK